MWLKVIDVMVESGWEDTLNSAHGAIVITNERERQMEEKESRKKNGGAALLAWKMESGVMVQESLWFLQLKRQDNDLLPRT